MSKEQDMRRKRKVKLDINEKTEQEKRAAEVHKEAQRRGNIARQIQNIMHKRNKSDS